MTYLSTLVSLICSKKVQNQVRSFMGCVFWFSFCFQVLWLLSGATGAPYGTKAMGAHGKKGLRKDILQWKTLRTTLLMLVLSFFLLLLDFWRSGSVGSLHFFFSLGKHKLYHQLFALGIDFRLYIILNFISVAVRPVCNFLYSKYL